MRITSRSRAFSSRAHSCNQLLHMSGPSDTPAWFALSHDASPVLHATTLEHRRRARGRARLGDTLARPQVCVNDASPPPPPGEHVGVGQQVDLEWNEDAQRTRTARTALTLSPSVGAWNETSRLSEYPATDTGRAPMQSDVTCDRSAHPSHVVTTFRACRTAPRQKPDPEHLAHTV